MVGVDHTEKTKNFFKLELKLKNFEIKGVREKIVKIVLKKFKYE